ncbi:PepSY domain-containing protein [Roseiterribacter gracilis]|uniref:PepSY domain-containing protein n=1 Tax=Roseiterribacter gracilis TaxID=2812848 RepID=A0A8S8XII5_9PROT|nr:hypothetical protein TMPK1_40590 [Rhodospirillales bacterium TMPK1]
MRSTKILTATAIASLLIGSAAFAGTKEDFATVSSAKHSLADAIGAAEKAAGGKATDAKFETEHGVSKYEVTVVQNGKRDILNVDLTTGAAVKGSEKNASSSKQQDAQTITAAKTGLAAAIATAEQQSGGKALEASLEKENGNPVYEVKLANGDKTQKVNVDASTGKIASAK